MVRPPLSSNNLGYSLTEIAIVLGVVGILLGGIWGLGNYAYESVRRQQMTDNIGIVVDKTRSFYQSLPRIDGDFGPRIVPATPPLTDQLVRRDIIPREMVPDRNLNSATFQRAITAWGGAFRVSDNTDNTQQGWRAGGQTFRIRMFDLPYAGCIAVMSKLLGGKPAGLLNVVFNNPDIPLATHMIVPTPSTSTNDARTRCRQNGQNWSVDLIYRLRI